MYVLFFIDSAPNTKQGITIRKFEATNYEFFTDHSRKSHPPATMKCQFRKHSGRVSNLFSVKGLQLAYNFCTLSWAFYIRFIIFSVATFSKALTWPKFLRKSHKNLEVK